MDLRPDDFFLLVVNHLQLAHGVMQLPKSQMKYVPFVP